MVKKVTFLKKSLKSFELQGHLQGVDRVVSSTELEIASLFRFFTKNCKDS